VNRRLPLFALAPALLLPSCSSFFELKNPDATAAGPRGAFRPTVADGTGFYAQAPARQAAAPAPVKPTPAPAPVAPIPAPAPVVAAPSKPVVAPAPAVAKSTPKPAELPAPTVKPAPIVKPTPAPVAKSAPAPAAVQAPPATKTRKPVQDGEQLRLPGDMLNELPSDKEYKSGSQKSDDGAPVIAKPPGSSR
jgi:outer membrane biosynthesis protein TonB